MRWLGSQMLVASLALGLVACSGQSTAGVSQTTQRPTRAAVGAVAGVVIVSGGPATTKSTHRSHPAVGYVVNVKSGGGIVASGATDDAGRFRITLRPGRYQLVCGSNPTFAIAEGGVTKVDCDVPLG